MSGYLATSAIVSDDERYRYLLGRRWGNGPTMTFVMLNPSTADATKDDQTIRRCVGYAKRDGFDAIAVVNLFGYRATFPTELWEATKAGVDVVGPDNLFQVRATLERSGFVVCGYGASAANQPPTPIFDLLRNYPLHCVGRTATGWPRHPSRGKYLPFEDFEIARPESHELTPEISARIKRKIIDGLKGKP